MFKISKELRDGLVIYLRERPFKEVEVGIKGLLSLEEIKEEKIKK